MRCFVSAPVEVSRAGVLRALEELDVEAITEYSVQTGTNWASALTATISEVDFVVVILSSRKPDPPALLIEIGAAIGRDRPILVVVPKMRRSRLNLSGVQYAVVDPDDSNALALHLRALIKTSASRHPETDSRYRGPQPAVASWLDTALAGLDGESDRPAQLGYRLEQIVEELFTRAGGISQIAPSSELSGPDFAGVFDGASPMSGVVLVEVKGSLRGRPRLEDGVQQLQRFVSERGAQLGVVAFWSGQTPVSEPTTPPGIVLLNLYDLADELRERSLAQILADRRNQSVHGR